MTTATTTLQRVRFKITGTDEYTQKPFGEPPKFHCTSTDGWVGFPVAAFDAELLQTARNCVRPASIPKARMSVKVEPDGSSEDGVELLRITKGKPVPNKDYPESWASWSPGWQATITVNFLERQFDLEDVVNLVTRVGAKGVGRGRPKDRLSAPGPGLGAFSVEKLP